MKFINKLSTWQVVSWQIFIVFVLTAYSLLALRAPLVGSIYALIGLRNLVAAQADFSNDKLVDIASISFEEAYKYKWLPSTNDTYLRLADAFVRRDNLTSAITALEKAYLNQRNRKEVQQELALAYEEIERFEAADDLWGSVGITTSRMFEIGDGYLEKFDYYKARIWYLSALRKAESPTAKQLFKSSLADLRMGGRSAAKLLEQLAQVDSTFNIYTLDYSIRIEGGDLRWTRALPDTQIDYGVLLSHSFPHGITSSGVLWAGGEGLAVLFVKEAGTYKLSAEVRHRTPPPIEMALGIDGEILQTFSLARGDESWETVGMNLDLTPGFHTVEAWFLNPKYIIGGEDRKAEVQSIMIESNKK